MLPLLLLFGLGAQIFMALLISVTLLLLLTLWGAGNPWRWLVPVLFVALLLLQLILPRMGFLSGAVEALKAVVLYMNGLHVVMPLFGGQVALLLSLCVSACAFLFSKKDVGFLPAAIMVVLVLFGLWALGEGGLIWYTAPALCALLLLISQTAHDKISVLNVLPMALAVVLLSLLLLPAGRVAVEPLEKAAFQLKQTITDYLFFTEPRNVFTLGSYGYYPMGGSQLGGEAEPSEYPVMIVKTERKTLIRGVVKDEYTGRAFRDTSSAKRYLYINPRWFSLREKVFMEKLPPDAIRKMSVLLDDKAITVQMQNRAASTVFTPLFLRSLNAQGNMVPYFNDASELFITRDLEAGDRYTVYTPVFEGGDGGLGALVNVAPKNDSNYAEMASLYTRLPDHLEQKVYDDVANIIRESETPYDKAMAIMRHLQKYYRYTLKTQTPPENLDFVTYFLYVSKEGYCTYYASAMTVLCRMAGLPARYVEGFLATPASDGLAYVTGKDAHAWTEVYFEGFGWVPFDPTPMQQGQNETPPNQEPEPEPDQQNEPEPTPTPPPDDNPEPSPEPPPPEDNQEPEPPPDEPPPDENPFPWWILLLAVAMAATLTVLIRRSMPDRVAARLPAEQDKLFAYGSAVNTILGFRKRTPKPGETPLLFAKRMDGVHAFSAPILPLWRMMTMSNYSGRNPGKEQSTRARDIFHQVYKPLSPLTKLRFVFAAVFNPRCYRSLDTRMVHEAAVSKTRLPGSVSIKKKKPVVKGASQKSAPPKAKDSETVRNGKTPKRH